MPHGDLMLAPPSTASAWPVTAPARSETKNVNARAMSYLLGRRNGCTGPPNVGVDSSSSSVPTAPGSTALTRIPYCPSSSANVLTRFTRPAFAAPYAAWFVAANRVDRRHRRDRPAGSLTDHVPPGDLHEEKRLAQVRGERPVPVLVSEVARRERVVLVVEEPVPWALVRVAEDVARPIREFDGVGAWTPSHAQVRPVVGDEVALLSLRRENVHAAVRGVVAGGAEVP